MENTEMIKKYYEKGGERERLDERFASVEFLTTVRYIEKYLFPGAHILEIGAGAGRYSHFFARKGYEVDAIELIPLHVEQFKRDTLPNEHIKITQGDARDLSAFEDNTYDITLILGPLYHLPIDEDKKKVISEALKVTKRGGMIFSAYILNEMTVMNYLFRNNRIADCATAENAVKSDFRLADIPEKGLSICRIEDINALMDDFDVERMHLVGTDMFSGMIRDMLKTMSEEAFDLYVKYIYTICERRDMIGTSGHILDIFRKI